MGREKDRLIEEEERGWYSTSTESVCNECVEDEYLANFILENGEPGTCDFCGSDSADSDIRCVPFDDLMDVIGDGINWAYRSADDEGQPYESAEGGYVFSESVFDTYDLVVEEVGLELHKAVLRSVLDALPDHMWCRRGFWSLSRNEELRFGWNGFVEKVKYQTRFLFTLPAPRPGATAPAVPAIANQIDFTGEDVTVIDDEPQLQEEHDDGIPAYMMLDSIGEVVQRFDLTSTLDKGNVLFRVRVADKSESFSNAAELGPPPRDLATQPNRMSPAGIVMFYGALDRATALAETFQPSRAGASTKNIWVSQFRALRDLRLLDLTNLPLVPSIFDGDNRHDRDDIVFLRSFVHDLVQPIERDGREHIDYVPTQIVTEYFRHRFRLKGDQTLDGILYRSSKLDMGVACVLFVDSEQCGAPSESWMQVEQVLALLEDQIEVVDGGMLSATSA